MHFLLQGFCIYSPIEIIQVTLVKEGGMIKLSRLLLQLKKNGMETKLKRKDRIV